MTLHQLRYFVEMCNTLHYTRTAEQLNISQPSLSYALSELSKELGVPLFEKSGKKVSLTEFGEAFLPYAESALHILSQGEAQISNMLNPTGGIINLGYIYSVSFDAIPHLVDEFYAAQGNRNIHFNLQVGMTSTLVEKLLDCTMDVVMAPLPEVLAEGISSVPVFNQELYLMVYNDHPLATRSTVTVEDFKTEKFVMIHKNSDLFLQTEALFKKHNVRPEIAFKVDECNSMAAFVGSQLGIAIMPNIPSLTSYKVTAIPFEGRSMNRSICLLWNTKCRTNPVVSSFINYFTSHQDQIRMKDTPHQ